MQKFIIPISTIALAGLTVFFLTLPVSREFVLQKAEIESLENAIAESEEVIRLRQSIINKRDLITEEDLAVLDKILPSRVDLIEKSADIQDFFARSPFRLTQNFSLSGEGVGVDRSVPRSEDGMVSNLGLGSLNISASVSGSYSRLPSFLEYIATNLDIMDISSISFSSDNENSEVYTYSINIKTYFLKQ